MAKINKHLSVDSEFFSFDKKIEELDITQIGEMIIFMEDNRNIRPIVQFSMIKNENQPFTIDHHKIGMYNHSDGNK